ncbi:MAG: hypothetical protein J1F28_10375 [Oscillospiraceae bacterium]|nr:hypothetical protein [Oscillospiraceae bacterium]
MNETNIQKSVTTDPPIRRVAMYCRFASRETLENDTYKKRCAEQQLRSYIEKLNNNPTWKIIRLISDVKER